MIAAKNNSPVIARLQSSRGAQGQTDNWTWTDLVSSTLAVPLYGRVFGFGDTDSSGARLAQVQFLRCEVAWCVGAGFPSPILAQSLPSTVLALKSPSSSLERIL